MDGASLHGFVRGFDPAFESRILIPCITSNLMQKKKNRRFVQEPCVS